MYYVYMYTHLNSKLTELRTSSFVHALLINHMGADPNPNPNPNPNPSSNPNPNPDITIGKASCNVVIIIPKSHQKRKHQQS